MLNFFGFMIVIALTFFLGFKTGKYEAVYLLINSGIIELEELDDEDVDE